LQSFLKRNPDNRQLGHFLAHGSPGVYTFMVGARWCWCCSICFVTIIQL
jgi:hypothetical protein